MKDSRKNFDNLLHPYMFALKEGSEFGNNFLDYSLLLLQVGRADTLPSPRSSTTRISNQISQVLKKQK